jgi:hypothetical protein
MWRYFFGIPLIATVPVIAIEALDAVPVALSRPRIGGHGQLYTAMQHALA